MQDPELTHCGRNFKKYQIRREQLVVSIKPFLLAFLPFFFSSFFVQKNLKKYILTSVCTASKRWPTYTTIRLFFLIRLSPKNNQFKSLFCAPTFLCLGQVPQGPALGMALGRWQVGVGKKNYSSEWSLLFKNVL